MARRRYSRGKGNVFGIERKINRRKKTKKISENVADLVGKSWIRVGRVKLCADDIIGFILSNGGEASINEIVGAFQLGRSYRKVIHGLLQSMCRDHLLLLTDDKQYRVCQRQNYYEAIMSVTLKGFAFALLQATGDKQLDDVYVSQANMSTAMHGDRVFIKIIQSRSGRDEGKVIRVLDRAVIRIVGVYEPFGAAGIVIPEDDRFPFVISVENGQDFSVDNGEAVVAVITEHDPGKTGRPKGEIIEKLGNPDSLQVQTEIVIRKFDLPHSFSEPTLKEVERIDSNIEMEAGRKDFRDIPHITIDGETARDFDDAVAIEKTRQGYRLYVSIADVSHYVKANTALDTDAYLRGTSVYFTTRVVPMLPERLSNDLCSLVPNKDRYAVSAILDFDRQGNITNTAFTKSIINSRHRMTYNLVSQILIDRDKVVRRNYKDMLTPLKWMGELGEQLSNLRMARGSIGFEIPEAYIEVNKNDEVVGINRRERNFAHKIIEEFMLAANEAVARSLADCGDKTALYRVHEQPDKVKVAEFSQFAKSMGLKLPQGDGSPSWFGKILRLVAGKPLEYIVNNLLLRTMKQARYAPDNVGHFGLAAEHYTHFTSPIRRYPDLIVHRALSKMISKRDKQVQGKKEKGVASDEAGIFLSKRERVAVDAEREMVDRMKVRYMADKVGEIFAGIISGVTSFGLFVELTDSFISGGVAISEMKDDYYSVDEKRHRLVGKRAGKIYQLGALVTVKVTNVDKRRRRINFMLIE